MILMTFILNFVRDLASRLDSNEDRVQKILLKDCPEIRWPFCCWDRFKREKVCERYRRAC